MSHAIEAQNLSFAFEDGHVVLHDLSFTVELGERVAILGGNGAGKSTLLWCLAGILRPRGHLRILGENAVKAREHLGLVFQNPEDQLFMPTLLEDLLLPQLNRGTPQADAEEKARELLRAVGLLDHANRPAHKLSIGQRKRAAIAMAMAAGPEILMMDEPTAELDRSAVRELQALLPAVKTTLLIVTHDLAFATRVTQRALVLSSGKLVWEGHPHEFLRQESLLLHTGL